MLFSCSVSDNNDDKIANFLDRMAHCPTIIHKLHIPPWCPEKQGLVNRRIYIISPCDLVSNKDCSYTRKGMKPLLIHLSPFACLSITTLRLKYITYDVVVYAPMCGKDENRLRQFKKSSSKAEKLSQGDRRHVC